MHSQPQVLESAAPAAADDDEISLLDVLIVLLKHKILILVAPSIVAVIAVAYALYLPPIFTATTRILPPQQSQSAASAMLSQLGGLAAAAGVGGSKANDTYLALLKSRTVADRLIQRFDLMTLWKSKYSSDAQKTLASISAIASAKDGTISIDVDNKDPKLAADIANAYVEELSRFMQTLALTEASQRRLFYEQQFAKAKDNLIRAELQARQGLTHNGVVKVDDQGRTLIESAARLRAQITVKEVQLGAMRSYAANGNPQLRMAQQELGVLRNELAKLEGSDKPRMDTPLKVGADGTDGSRGLANLGLLRELKYQETLYELLARQYEMAKIDEAKDAPLIQVIDKAIAPDKKSKPKRAQIVLLSAIAAFFVAIIAAFLKEGLERARTNPTHASRLNTLRQYLSWRR
ncbi:MAG TPA: Wzz/FepE/Etk N-terminal domain-containing protein [Rhodocyclaceae bacterium]|nr:Wzz/FepE/Etk N-terminal domain-containing protein [Rhodocyclaceae bacterium]